MGGGDGSGGLPRLFALSVSFRAFLFDAESEASLRPNNVAKRCFEWRKVTFPLRGEERCSRRCGEWNAVPKKWGAKGVERERERERERKGKSYE